MRIILHHKEKGAALWVPKGVPEEQVSAGIKTYAGTHRVVVYRSGGSDLTACTEALFRVNQR